MQEEAELQLSLRSCLAIGTPSRQATVAMIGRPHMFTAGRLPRRGRLALATGMLRLQS